MKYISIDLETTGLDYNTCQILEFAAIIEDTSKRINIDKLPSFRRLIYWDKIHGDTYAILMNFNIINEMYSLANNGFNEEICNIGNLEYEFKQFLKNNEIDTTKPLNVAGKNFNAFDKRFLEKQFIDIKFSHRCLDPGSLYFINTDEKIPDLKTCLDRAKITKQVAHRALDDAKDVIQLIRKIKGDY